MGVRAPVLENSILTVPSTCFFFVNPLQVLRVTGRTCQGSFLSTSLTSTGNPVDSPHTVPWVVPPTLLYNQDQQLQAVSFPPGPELWDEPTPHPCTVRTPGSILPSPRLMWPLLTSLTNIWHQLLGFGEYRVPVTKVHWQIILKNLVVRMFLQSPSLPALP